MGENMGGTADVIVIGAGLAGATAAADLAERGLAVTILEARDRVGGRGFTRAFAGTEDELDYGGSWITPWQEPIRTLCRKHGVALRPRHEVTQRRWFRDGELHHDGPVSMRDLRAHEAATARLAMDVAHVSMGRETDEEGRTLAGVSFADYMARIGAPEATRQLMGAWWTVSGNGPHSQVPASEFIRSCGHFDGTPEGIMAVWSESLAGGVSGLVQRMIERAGVRLLLSAPVEAIEHRPGGVTAQAAGGLRLKGKAAVVATGLNLIGPTRFDPPLPPQKAEAALSGHLGRAVKLWIKARGVPVGALATGGGTGIEWMFAERQAADGATLLVGFGLADPAFDPASPRQAAEALHGFFPEARFVAHDWHDWIADPWSRGTWVTTTLGAEAATDAASWGRHGPLAFASSDFSPEGAGWFDAAVISGHHAAGEVLEFLGRN